MSSNEDAQMQAYKDDPRVPCQYGVKCYQKNSQHQSKYKHPPKKETVTCNLQLMKNVEKKTEKATGEKRKNSFKDNGKAHSKSPERKLQKTQEPYERNLHNLSPSPERTDVVRDNNENDKDIFSDKVEASTEGEKISLNRYNSHNSTKHNVSEKKSDAERIIMDLFLVEMPDDFFKFHEFCKSISKDNPLSACKSVRLKLVGPYDVLDGKIKISSSENDKEKYLTHWRYYYDPPEFQTIVKCDDKEGLHFGYWRDDAAEKPVFVATNRANVNGVFEPVAENIFGAIDSYLQNKVKSANPFEKTSITRLHSQLKNFAKQHDITLEKNTADMRARERRVVARTFHRAGIIVPYDKKTQLGYRDLAATDSDLQKILKQIEEAGTPEERKTPIAKLDEIVRLATIAADECDFGTCLELGHDLFSNGNIHVQTTALQMLSIAYTHLKRPHLLKIFEAHLKNRKKGCDLGVI
ncbi:histone PARylation factor 1 isoform X1 [Temnothorax americanus]|uniref:histone PARylation factor 1 isoform X1 n=1 Tax=Temnothorax americanus TaxID=1964332 RepID=UPI004067B435